jgi:hypothetical protein
MSAAEPLKPTLVVNPADDGLFAEFAQIIVEDDTMTIAEFERHLRAVYPRAAVHARLLAAEPGLIWYVYREGRWVDPGIGAQPARMEHDDARPARGLSRDSGLDPAGRRAGEDPGGTEEGA